jgi:hypothetical protein
MFFSFGGSAVVPRVTAWAPRSSTCDERGRRRPRHGATIKKLRRAASGAAGNGLGATIKYLRRTTSAAAGNGLGITAKCL